MWQQWANVVLGLWVIAVPFIGLTAAAYAWTLTITGIVIAALALWGGSYEQSDAHRNELQHRTA